MDSASKQDAIVVEVTEGTTPSSPSFLLLRSTRISGSPQRAAQRSSERRADRRAANMVDGLNNYAKTIEMPYQRDAATDVLWELLLNGAFSTNVLKDASTAKSFTMEEKYLATTAPYRRATGCRCNTLSLSFRLGEEGKMNWGLLALGEANATSAIGSSTYAAPTPGYDPVSSNDFTATTMFGLTTPKMTGLTMNITNNMNPLHKFGTPEPFANGLGLFDVSGSIEYYFTAAADYTAFVTRALAQTFNATIGSVTNYKDKIEMGSVDVFNPDIGDPGQSGQHMVTANFMARYYASDTAAFKFTRLVA